MAAKRKSASRKAARTTAARRTATRRTATRRTAVRKTATPRRRRKASSYQSALSMLTFYINRGGRQLPKAAKRVLNQAKTELRKLYSRKVSRRR
jgi:hypothetical protein